jgi:prevent-host-death family protein
MEQSEPFSATGPGPQCVDESGDRCAKVVQPVELYVWVYHLLYILGMEVAVSELRANLSEWVARARRGDEVLVTERGVAVARLTGIDASATVERLVEQGHISRPVKAGPRPIASGRTRPRAKDSISDIVSDQRR